MDPFAHLDKTIPRPRVWDLKRLAPPPEEEWQRMKSFIGLGHDDTAAMLQTVEVLLKRGHELVVGNYDYLLKNHETAVILGWENGADEAHLAERRRFFTVWLARLLGLDFSDDFARYLFRAGQYHAAHGPRQVHVPEVYITGAISLVNATFARFLSEDMPGHPAVPLALAGWNKALSMHLHMMILGYHVARALDSGDFAVQVSMFGRMRTITGRQTVQIRLDEGAPVAVALQKFFNYFPHARPEVFNIDWQGGERLDSTGTPWFEAEKIYTVKPMWRVLLNGKDLSYIGGPEVPVSAGDELSVFPPGR